MGHSDLRTVAELVEAAGTGVHGAESDVAAVEVLAVFDHDYHCHVLVQEWDRTAVGGTWVYRLWFKDGGLAVPVHRFDDARWPTPPFVHAATIVAEWREMSDTAHRAQA